MREKESGHLTTPFFSLDNTFIATAKKMLPKTGNDFYMLSKT